MSVSTFSLTNGGTAQLLAPADNDRTAIFLQPVTETTVFNFGATAGIQATGSYSLAAKPAINDTLGFNGTTFTFVASSASAVQITIGATLATALANAIAILNASVTAGVALATYTTDGANLITVTADAGGTDGNAYTLDTATGGNVTRSAATLAGGLNTAGGLVLVANQVQILKGTEFPDIRQAVYAVSPTDGALVAWDAQTWSTGR